MGEGFISQTLLCTRNHLLARCMITGICSLTTYWVVLERLCLFWLLGMTVDYKDKPNQKDSTCACRNWICLCNCRKHTFWMGAHITLKPCGALWSGHMVTGEVTSHHFGSFPKWHKRRYSLCGNAPSIFRKVLWSLGKSRNIGVRRALLVTTYIIKTSLESHLETSSQHTSLLLFWFWRVYNNFCLWHSTFPSWQHWKSGRRRLLQQFLP